MFPTARALFFVSLIALSQSWAQAMTPEQEQTVERGLDALYRSDYDGAERIFEEPMRKRPDDPVLSLGYAAVQWWRMESDFALPGSSDEQKFLAAAKQAVDVAKQAERGKDKAQAYLCLGAAYGLKGRWEASQRHWVAAYLDGRRAYRDEQKAIKLDGQLYDAYLGIGAFDYYVATLSRFIRAFSFAADGGNKAKGLAELQLAAERGHFSSVGAKMLLVGIYWTFEKKPQEAWKILDELHQRYPESPLIDSMRLLGLFHLKDAAGLKRDAQIFLEKAQRDAPFFRPSDRFLGRYFLGLGAQLSGQYDQAIQEYKTALDEVPPRHRGRSMLRLFIGEALDLVGRRDEALASYRQALEEPPLWGVPQYARQLLKRPFKAGDNPLPSRNAEAQ